RASTARGEVGGAAPLAAKEGPAGERPLGLLDPPAGVADLRLPGVPNPKPEPAAVADRLLDAVPEVMQVDHHLVDAARAQEVQDVRQHGTARDRHQWLWQLLSEVSEARAASRRQHHRAMNHVASAPSSAPCPPT